MNADLLWTFLTSSLAISTITTIIAVIKDFIRSRKRDRIILFFIVKGLATDAIWDKYISTENLKALEDAYAEYKALGGNGFADTLMNRARALPIKEDE